MVVVMSYPVHTYRLIWSFPKMPFPLLLIKLLLRKLVPEVSDQFWYILRKDKLINGVISVHYLEILAILDSPSTCSLCTLYDISQQEQLLLDPMFDVPNSKIASVWVEKEAVLGSVPVSYKYHPEHTTNDTNDTNTTTDASESAAQYEGESAPNRTREDSVAA